MWQTTSTPRAINAAATMPHSCEVRLMALTKLSIGLARIGCRDTRRGGARAAPRAAGLALFDAQRRVDQFLSVRNFLGELRVRAFARDLDPLVVFGGSQRDHLDLVVLEHPEIGRASCRERV